MKDKGKTNVTFLIEKNGDKENVLAIFRNVYEYYKYSKQFACYATIGQHQSANIEYIKECRLATKEEYNELFNELENNINYNLKVIQKKMIS